MIQFMALLFLSNIFMTFAWYGHLKNHRHEALWWVILLSWGIAFFEYCLQVPANRLGAEHFSLPQLKIVQEVVTMIVFAGFATFYMKIPLKWDYVWASFCLVGAVYFIFRTPAPPTLQ
jgi:uncharacterized protein (DUF486 family)